MASEYAFETFETGASSTQIGNVTTETNACSAQLDYLTCPPNPSVAIKMAVLGDLGGRIVHYHINDRGSEFSDHNSIKWHNCPGKSYPSLIFASCVLVSRREQGPLLPELRVGMPGSACALSWSLFWPPFRPGLVYLAQKSVPGLFTPCSTSLPPSTH